MGEARLGGLVRLRGRRTPRTSTWDDSSSRHHTRALVDDLAAGRMDRANAYAARCAAEKNRRRLAASPPPLAPLDRAHHPPRRHPLRALLPPSPRRALPRPPAPLAPRPASPSARLPAPGAPPPTPPSTAAPLHLLPAPGDQPGSHLARRMIVHPPSEPPPPRRPGAHLADTMIVDRADELRTKAAQLLAAPAALDRPPPCAAPSRGPPTPRAPSPLRRSRSGLRLPLRRARRRRGAQAREPRPYGLADPPARRAPHRGRPRGCRRGPCRGTAKPVPMFVGGRPVLHGALGHP